MYSSLALCVYYLSLVALSEERLVGSWNSRTHVAGTYVIGEDCTAIAMKISFPMFIVQGVVAYEVLLSCLERYLTISLRVAVGMVCMALGLASFLVELCTLQILVSHEI
jgi:hypothetical protein